MKDIKELYNGSKKAKIRVNQKGKILYDSGYLNFLPKAYGEYFMYNNKKITTKKLNVNNIKKKTFTAIDGYQMFTTNKKIVNADLTDGATYDTIKTTNVKKNTKFKILKFINEKIINVQLSNGQKGYLFVTGI